MNDTEENMDEMDEDQRNIDEMDDTQRDMDDTQRNMNETEENDGLEGGEYELRNDVEDEYEVRNETEVNQNETEMSPERGETEMNETEMSPERSEDNHHEYLEGASPELGKRMAKTTLQPIMESFDAKNDSPDTGAGGRAHLENTFAKPRRADSNFLDNDECFEKK